MDDRVTIPTVETYRGVGVHDFQPRERIESVVKPAIDRIYGLSDIPGLVSFARDSRNPPEVRLFAVARCEAIWELAAANREIRPRMDLAVIRASVPGLSSLRWLNPRLYTSLLDPSRDALPRDRPTQYVPNGRKRERG